MQGPTMKKCKKSAAILLGVALMFLSMAVGGCVPALTNSTIASELVDYAVVNTAPEYHEFVIEAYDGTIFKFLFPGNLPKPYIDNYYFSEAPLNEFYTVGVIVLGAVDESHSFGLIIDYSKDSRPPLLLMYLNRVTMDERYFIYKDGKPIPADKDAFELILNNLIYGTES